MWSEQTAAVWAKTQPDSGGWLSLVNHLADSAAVAGHLWDEFLSPAVRSQISAALNAPEAEARVLACWLAGLHDLGKASPSFAAKAQFPAPHLTARMRDVGLEARTEPEDPGHATVGQALLREWLVATFGVRLPLADSFACVIGGHHGRNPSRESLRGVANRPHLRGGASWHHVQQEILEGVAARTGADAHLAQWLQRPLPPTVQALLSGLVIMADWIASNESYFPYDDPGPTPERLALAMADLGLPRPWAPAQPPEGATAHLRGRFPTLTKAQARPLQELVLQALRACDAPGLTIIEAPMGEGKTEAAWLGAEVIAHRFGLGGMFVGLPTMATTNPMFTRMLAWLNEAIGSEDASVALAHGKASLNEEYAKLGRQSWSGRLYDDHDSARGRALVNSWLRGNKRRGLASFVAGTIDQSLFAGLKAKHVVLRHLGLAGKVVVLDEVHSADVYMRRYLSRVLTWLGAYRTPVILLSATLAPDIRDEFLRAYADGWGTPWEGATDREDHYPRVTLFDGAVRSLWLPPAEHQTTVRVRRLSDDVEALSALLTEELSGGGCAGVICNTVGRAQEAYARLRDAFGPCVELAHSRFIAPDRARRERDLVDKLGPNSGSRPHRWIVVGTQVLEQSLDIDFDILVSDLAPVDLVLQRIGRLHRHARVRPDGLTEPTVWLRGVDDWAGSPPVAVRGSRTVYGASSLLRSAAVLDSRDSLQIPADIPKLVRMAYEPALTPPTQWEEEWAVAETRARSTHAESSARAEAFLLNSPVGLRNLNGLIDVDAGDPEGAERKGRAQVRDSGDSIEVVALQRDADGVLRLPDGVDRFGGAAIPEGPVQWSAAEEPLAHAMASCTLRLPAMTSAPWAIDAVLADLERQLDYSPWQTSQWIAGELAIVFDADGRAEIGPFALAYDDELGLRVTRKEAA